MNFVLLHWPCMSIINYVNFSWLFRMKKKEVRLKVKRRMRKLHAIGVF